MCYPRAAFVVGVKSRCCVFVAVSDVHFWLLEVQESVVTKSVVGTLLTRGSKGWMVIRSWNDVELESVCAAAQLEAREAYLPCSLPPNSWLCGAGSLRVARVCPITSLPRIRPWSQVQLQAMTRQKKHDSAHHMVFTKLTQEPLHTGVRRERSARRSTRR